MPESQNKRYLVTEPIKGRTIQSMTLVNEKLIPGCNLDIMFNWIIKMPEYNAERAAGHSHDYDEVILNIGADPQNPEYLGGEIEGFMGDEKQIINTTSAIFCFSIWRAASTALSSPPSGRTILFRLFEALPLISFSMLIS